MGFFFPCSFMLNKFLCLLNLFNFLCPMKLGETVTFYGLEGLSLCKASWAVCGAPWFWWESWIWSEHVFPWVCWQPPPRWEVRPELEPLKPEPGTNWSFSYDQWLLPWQRWRWGPRGCGRRPEGVVSPWYVMVMMVVSPSMCIAARAWGLAWCFTLVLVSPFPWYTWRG